MFGWFRKNHPLRAAVDRWRLDTPLFAWDGSGKDVFTIGDSYRGLLCLGATGSGKSSATGKTVALAELAAGYGGLVLTVKPGEREVWEGYCRATGRLDDLHVVDDSGRYRLNYLDELLKGQGRDAGLTENILSLFLEVAQVGSRHAKAGGQGENDFFYAACKQLVRNLVDLLIMAGGQVSVAELCRLVMALPQSKAEIASEEWRKTNYCYRLLDLADRNPKSARQARDFRPVLDYVCTQFAGLAERTRSSIVVTFTSMADLFQRGLLFDLFSTDTTLSPRAIREGAIILIDLPVKRYGEVGLYAQLVWKLMTQRFLESRPVTADTRPAFLFIDEAQFFASQQSDVLFATTCRAFQVSNLLLSQSVAGFESAFGGDGAATKLAEQLFANLTTKVIHATGESGTATWASELIGRSYRMLSNLSGNFGSTDWAAMTGLHGESQCSFGMSESLQYEVEPREFQYLRTGGPENDFFVDGILIRSGKRSHATGCTWRPVTFRQK